jgi:DNA-binding beta-propeller fold protein YncE
METHDRRQGPGRLGPGFRRANKIAVVSTADEQVGETLPEPAYPDLVTMEPSGRDAFVTNRWTDAVTLVDLAPPRQVKRIAVGKAPHGMALRR